jgi:DNA-binding XRE family transcriptional regulator
MPNNGIRSFRRQLGITQAELALRVNTTRQQIGRLEDGKRKLTMQWATDLAKVLNCRASDLMFPETAMLGDSAGYRNVFLAQTGSPDEHAISLHSDILKRLMMEASSNRLELHEINTNDIKKSAGKGDFLLVDRDITAVTGPGVYLIDIAGVRSWRYLSPSATGRTVLVHSDNEQMAPEAVTESDLTILGRARAKLAAL